MKNDETIAGAEDLLKSFEKIKDGYKEAQESAQQAYNDLAQKVALERQALSSIQATKNALDLGNDSIYKQNTYSTTQFFNGSLAKDVFNMSGNSSSWYYKTFARKARGMMTQGYEAYYNNQNNISGNDSENMNPNTGSGVGWTDNKTMTAALAQKWWAWWVVELAAIQKLAGLVDFETENVKLKILLHKAYQLAILSGAAVIEKGESDKYRCFNAYDIVYDDWGEPVKCRISNADWFWNNKDAEISEDDDDAEIDLTNDKYVLLQWDINNYNVWFYTVFYTIDYIDLLWVWLSRTFISKPQVFQLIGDPSSAQREAAQLLNPTQYVIQVSTAGLESASANDLIKSSRSNELAIANRFQYLQLGDSQADAIFSTFPKIWLNIWESILGIIPPNTKTDAQRSITDEVEPNQTINQILQKKYGFTLELFKEDMKNKFGVEINYKLAYEEAEEKEESDANPAFKNEGGNETEQKEKAGEVDEK